VKTEPLNDGKRSSIVRRSKKRLADVPFSGGAIGYFGYDLGRRLERLPSIAAADIDMPDLAVGIYDWAVVVDHGARRTRLVGLGRDPRTIGKSWLGSFILAPTHEQAEAARNDFLARRGMKWDTLPEPVRDIVNRALVLGDPDTVGERVQREILEPGLDGIVVNLPADAHVEGAVERAAATLRKALG